MSKLIAIEGLDGSGKGTQSKLLCERLRQMGYSAEVMDFPDYESDGSIPVKMYLGGKLGTSPSDVNAYAASVLFCTDRLVSWKTKWEKIFSETDFIIANRYTTANAYHQLSKLPEDGWDSFLAWLWDTEYDKVGLPRPDRVIMLINPPENSVKMIEKRCAETGVKKDIHEADTEYLRRCYKAALYTGEKCAWTVINCVNANGEMIPRGEMTDTILKSIADIVNKA